MRKRIKLLPFPRCEAYHTPGVIQVDTSKPFGYSYCMATKRVPLVAGETYHIFNRSIARQPIFLNQKDYQRAFDVLKYYRYSNLPLRFSYYNRLPIEQRVAFLKELAQKGEKQVQIFAYSLMPNHFHFLINGITETGLTSFISNVENSYAKYFNIKYERTGSLFQSKFKGAHIETEEQLLHVMRYIHLNPVTSYILKDNSELEKYPWSSYTEYINQSSVTIEPELINSFFTSIEDFKQFHSDQIDYQRELDKIKHLTLE